MTAYLEIKNIFYNFMNMNLQWFYNNTIINTKTIERMYWGGEVKTNPKGKQIYKHLKHISKLLFSLFAQIIFYGFI